MKPLRPVAWTLKTAPAEEPITTAVAKAHLRVDIDDDNTLIDALVTAARFHAEHVTRRAIITQTWTAYFDVWPCERMELAMASPLASVTSVKYTDTDAAESTLATSVYDVDTAALVGNIRLAYGQSWPSADLDVVNPIAVEYVAGYGLTASVPQSLIEAMLLHIGHMYENREQAIAGTIVSELPMAYDALIQPHRVWTF